jgi:hypothetical protein
LVAACGGGHLAVAEWLATLGVERQPAPPPTVSARCAGAGEALWSACANGHLEVAQWLVKKYGHVELRGRGAPAGPGGCVALFRVVCGGGHLDVAKWIAAEFGLTAADVRADDHATLIAACAGGHLATAKWVAAWGGPLSKTTWVGMKGAVLGRREKRVPDCFYFDYIYVESRNLQCIHAYWLAPSYIRAFCNASAGGHLATARWLVSTFGPPDVAVLRDIGRDDGRDDYVALHLFRGVCSEGHLATARWLVETLGLGDARALRPNSVLASLLFDERGCLATAQWLAAAFGLCTSRTAGALSYMESAVARNGAHPMSLEVRQGGVPRREVRQSGDELTLGGRVCPAGTFVNKLSLVAALRLAVKTRQQSKVQWLVAAFELAAVAWHLRVVAVEHGGGMKYDSITQCGSHPVTDATLRRLRSEIAQNVGAACHGSHHGIDARQDLDWLDSAVARSEPPVPLFAAHNGACVVCLCAPPTCVFVPCGHIAACGGCAARLRADATCIVCRAPLDAVWQACE